MTNTQLKTNSETSNKQEKRDKVNWVLMNITKRIEKLESDGYHYHKDFEYFQNEIDSLIKFRTETEIKFFGLVLEDEE